MGHLGITPARLVNITPITFGLWGTYLKLRGIIKQLTTTGPPACSDNPFLILNTARNHGSLVGMKSH